MMARCKTINDAAHEWVREFNAFPTDMIEKVMEIDPDAWHEVTVPQIGNRVYVYNTPADCDAPAQSGEITGYDEEEDGYQVELDDGTKITVLTDDVEMERYDSLPMWGTMWQFGDSCDDYWLSDMDGIEQMSRCGFRIYEHDEWGFFFGIDGAGYDFYDAHWIPLYKARGLEWHDIEEVA